MKIALIGGGMVGQCYGHAFAEAGHTICGVWDLNPSQALLDFASSHRTELYTEAGAWLAQADVVLSAVFGKAALDVAEPAFSYLRRGTLYVDMTTADPEHMARAGKDANASDVEFVDVAITGSVDVHRAKTPLLCSGARAAQVVEIFRQIDSPIQMVGDKPGDA